MPLQAYQPNWAFRRALRKKAARWQRQLLVSPAQLGTIEAAYPLDYYRPAWPLRVVAADGPDLSSLTRSLSPLVRPAALVQVPVRD